MKKLIHIAFIIFLWSLSAQAERQRVLVLHSYHQGLKWTDNVTHGIMSVLKDSSNIQLQLDYLDSKRNPSQEYLNVQAQLYRMKMRQSHFDAIITVDDNALEFVRRNREDLFPNIPVVFCAINNYYPGIIDKMDHVTGITENLDISSTLDIMLRLHPKLDTIVVLNDYSTTTAQRNRKRLEKIIPKFSDRVVIESMENLPIPGLLSKVRNFKSNKAILLLNFNKDLDGHFISYLDLIHLLKKNTQVPIYSSWQFFLGEGIVGGMLASGFTQGEEAANFTLQILAGKDPQSIPIDKMGKNHWMFDYRELNRFHIESGQLPQGSRIINLPPSFYELYKPIIWLCIGFFVLMVFLLYFSTYLQRQREKHLLAANAELDKKVEERTSELLLANETLIHQQQRIIRQNDELENHRHNLLKLVKERTSDLEKANKLLRNNHDRIRNILDANSDGFWECNVKNRDYYISPNFWNKLEYNLEEINQHANFLMDIMHDKDLINYQQKLDQYLNDEAQLFKCEFRLKNKNDEWLWFLAKGKTIQKDKFGSPEIIVGTYLNITSRKQAEAKNRENHITVLKAILEAEERERRRVALDLHDGIGPILSSIKLAVSALKKAKTEERKEEVLGVANAGINEAIVSIKEIANNLSPHILNDFGLVYAINNFIHKFNVSGTIQIRFKTNVINQRFDSNVEVILYRVTTELVNNTIKHAKAQNIEIDLTQSEKKLELIFTDDGIGLNNGKFEAVGEEGMGINNIRNRIKSIRGKIRMENNDNGGLFVKITVGTEQNSPSENM